MITTAVNPLLAFGLQYMDGSGYPQVNTFADLPDPVANAGLIYVVLTPTGIYILNRKDAGMYYSDGVS